MSPCDDHIPALSDEVSPPLVCGTADLATFAYPGRAIDEVEQRIARFHHGRHASFSAAAREYDAAIACQLGFRREEGLARQDAALRCCQIYRIGAVADPPAGRVGPPLRLLAVAAPGDLMVNAPIDFLTNHLNVRLDLLYLLADRPLPPVIPDHDVALFAVSEADATSLPRLRALFAAWARPVLNDPRLLPMLARDALSRSLAGVDGIRSPTTLAVTRAELEAAADARGGGNRCAPGFPPYPFLARPKGSHAGAGLARIASAEKLAEYLLFSFEREFFVTAFEDYSGKDGFYRKSRVAFIDRQPFLCHMAVSRHWKVHYLNAGMTESAEKRMQEADAMAGFERDFAPRHAAAFAALHERLDFDYYSIDCAETRDGRLLVFEADTAAIIHLMDPPDMFPYKQQQMRKIFAAFGDLLHRVGAVTPSAPPSRCSLRSNNLRLDGSLEGRG